MSVNPSLIGKNMTSGNKTNWNVFGKKRKDSDEVQSRKRQFISYPGQAHFASLQLQYIANKVKLLWIS